MPEPATLVLAGSVVASTALTGTAIGVGYASKLWLWWQKICNRPCIRYMFDKDAKFVLSHLFIEQYAHIQLLYEETHRFAYTTIGETKCLIPLDMFRIALYLVHDNCTEHVVILKVFPLMNGNAISGFDFWATESTQSELIQFVNDLTNETLLLPPLLATNLDPSEPSHACQVVTICLSDHSSQKTTRAS